MILMQSELEALERLSETGGLPAGDIAFIVYGERDRSRAAKMARTMKGLLAIGMVAKLDDKKPICWVRTPDGTRELRRRRLAADPLPAPATPQDGEAPCR